MALSLTRLTRRCLSSRLLSSAPDLVKLDYPEANPGIALLGMNRAPVNAVSLALGAQLREALEDIKQNKKLQGVILYSTVPKIFCAGADLKERLSIKEEDVPTLVRNFRLMIQDMAELPMPVICAIDGVAMGGGLELALGADIRISSHDSRMALSETKLAIIPGGGGTQRLPRVVGVSRAKELIFTGRDVYGEEAERIGLVSFSVPQNSTHNAAFLRSMELASVLEERGPVALRMAKKAITEGVEAGPVRAGLEIEGAAYNGVIPTTDRIEALMAFREKRKPNFKGE